MAALLLAVLASASASMGTTVTFQNGVLPDSSYAGCQDNWIHALNPTLNYGTNTWGNGIGYYSGAIKRSLIKFDVSAVPPTATVTSATLRLLMNTIGANRTVEAYQVLQPWTQTGSTWNNYATSLAWTTAGCAGSGTDRTSSAAGSVSVTTSQAGTWIEISLDSSLVQGWVSGTTTNNGVLLKDTSETVYEMRYRAENYTTTTERPQLVIQYSLDVMPPAAGADLAAGSPTGGSLTLTWTAPGDDGSTGTAASYDIRYATSAINDANWASATQATGEPTPAVAGSNESMTISGLTADTTYYFALKTTDDNSNVSALSNIASGRTSDVTAPAAVANLATSNPTGTSVTLGWTAPGDDGSTGTAASYDIRYSTATITGANWDSATPVAGAPAPAAAGTNQSMTVSGLSDRTTYYFAMKTSDETPNVSALSNVASATTPDATAPAAVANLATGASTATSITLSWTAPGDDGSSGTASSYDIRYSTSTITDANWASATQATGEPTPAAAGTNQSLTISGLSSGTYYFALKSTDDAANTSALSNVASGQTTLAVFVDLGQSGVNVGPATGYTLLLNTNRFDNSTQVSLGNGITAGYLHSMSATWSYRDRGASYPTLLRDLAMFQSMTVLDPIEVRGLPAGTYSVTLYAWDPQYHNEKSVFDLDGNHDGTTDASVTVDNTLSQQQKTAVVVVNATGILTINPHELVSGLAAVCNGFDIVSGITDNTAPAAVTNLATSNPTGSSVTLSWTAPGDDGSTGTAASYDIRYSASAITEANWASATQATGEPVPAAAGTNQSMTVSGLSPSTTYYFALKTTDDASNVSALSNVPTGGTNDVTAPAAVTTLAASNPASHSLTLTWTAPGDDAGTGTAASYDIRYSTSTITSANFASATPASGAPTPAVAGTSQHMTVSGLTASTTYYFAMKTSDEIPNVSALSNVVSCATAAPGTIGEVAMTVAEHNNVARSGEVISGGVPFVVGDLTSTTGLCVKDASNNSVPAQFQVLNRWWAPNYDDSIKWLQVIFPADVAANGSNTYYLTQGTNPAPALPVSVAVNGTTYTVNTGKIKAVINGSAFKLFDQVWYDVSGNGQYEAGEQIVSAATSDGLVITSGEWSALGIAAGDEFRSSAGTVAVTVEESGPVRAVLCITGTLQRSGQAVVNPYYEYTVRLYFSAGSPNVRCDATLKNNRIVSHTVYSWPIEDFSLRTTVGLTGTKQYALAGQSTPVRGTVGSNVVKMYQDSSGTDFWYDLDQSSQGERDFNVWLCPWTGGLTVRGVTFRGYQAYDGTTSLEQNNYARGWVDLNNGTLGVAAGVKHFWQQFPKALRINGSRLEVSLLPTEWSELFSLHDGSRKIHKVMYSFHGGSLTDQQVSDTYLKAERPLQLRCDPSTYVMSKAWDLGLGPVTGGSVSSYDRYATTGSHIGIKYGWDWFGWLPSYNAGGSHENETSMFMPYVLWGDWRNFESSEDKALWGDLNTVVAYDQPDFNVNWHYLVAFPNSSGTGMVEMRYPDWYKRAVWNRPDSGHCGMLQNLEYYYLTGDRQALELVKYNAQLANYYLWPRFDKVPTWYSSYSGNVDDPNFQISDRYYAWPIFNLVQAYQATGDTTWLSDATIGIRGMRNTLRISPLKFANELIHPAGDSSLAYWNQWSAAVRATAASQGYANFCAPGIASKAAGQYYLATGDMDAFDLLVAAADFTCESGARRDGNGNVLGFYYAWGDYWGPSDPTTTTYHGDVANGLGMATQFARKAEYLTDISRVWAGIGTGSWPYVGWLMNVVTNPDADQTPPAAVSTLAATPAGTGQITVSWNAPGDNGSTGTAWRYQLKCSTSSMVEKVTGWPDLTPPLPQTVNDWKSRSATFMQTQRPFVHGTNVLSLPTPAVAGTAQSKTVTGLTSGTRYYFAIKTLDAAGNFSDISNVVNAVAP